MSADENGKIALVTGASRGIGRAAALALGRDGTQVLVHYVRNEGAAEAVVREIRDAGGRAEAVSADLAKRDGPRELAAKARALIGDQLHILVCNAGTFISASIEEMKIDDFDLLHAVNVRAPYFLVQELLPVLGAGSSVILTSSTLATDVPTGDLSAYASTKGAIDTLTRHFAFALGPKGVRVNAVAPGVIDTDMSSWVRSDQGSQFTLGFQALKRIGQPDDVGDAIAYLASEAARWMTGQTLRVDGGTRL